MEVKRELLEETTLTNLAEVCGMGKNGGRKNVKHGQWNETVKQLIIGKK